MHIKALILSLASALVLSAPMPGEAQAGSSPDFERVSRADMEVGHRLPLTFVRLSHSDLEAGSRNFTGLSAQINLAFYENHWFALEYENLTGHNGGREFARIAFGHGHPINANNLFFVETGFVRTRMIGRADSESGVSFSVGTRSRLAPWFELTVSANGESAARSWSSITETFLRFESALLLTDSVDFHAGYDHREHSSQWRAGFRYAW